MVDKKPKKKRKADTRRAEAQTPTTVAGVGQDVLRGKTFNPATGRPETAEQRKTREADRGSGGFAGSKRPIKDIPQQEGQPAVRQRLDLQGEPITEPEEELSLETATGTPAFLEGERSTGAPLLSGEATPVTAEDVIDIIGFKGGAGLLIGSFKGVGKRATSSAISSTTKSQAARGAQQTTKAVAGRFATNSKSLLRTVGFMAKRGYNKIATGGLIAAIGSYPFAGFLKQEALQTLGFAAKAARDADDLDGEQRALNEQREMLNPDNFQKLLAAVPYANVLAILEGFYSAAVTKLDIDQAALDKKRGTLDT